MAFCKNEEHHQAASGRYFCSSTSSYERIAKRYWCVVAILKRRMVMADFYRVCGGFSENPKEAIAVKIIHEAAIAMQKEADLNPSRLKSEFLQNLYQSGRSAIALRNDEEIIAHAAIID